MKTLYAKEKDLCIAFYNQVQTLQSLNYFKKPFFIFHIANESFTSKAYAMQLKRMGVTAGIADYCIIKNGSVMFIEFKRNKDAKVQQSQKNFMDLCKKFDIKCLITYNIEEAIQFIKDNI
jgi:galactokinase/mevalonate kinase-like predicted kinase